MTSPYSRKQRCLMGLQLRNHASHLKCRSLGDSPLGAGQPVDCHSCLTYPALDCHGYAGCPPDSGTAFRDDPGLQHQAGSKSTRTSYPIAGAPAVEIDLIVSATRQLSVTLDQQMHLAHKADAAAGNFEPRNSTVIEDLGSKLTASVPL